MQAFLSFYNECTFNIQLIKPFIPCILLFLFDLAFNFHNCLLLTEFTIYCVLCIFFMISSIWLWYRFLNVLYCAFVLWFSHICVNKSMERVDFCFLINFCWIDDSLHAIFYLTTTWCGPCKFLWLFFLCCWLT